MIRSYDCEPKTMPEAELSRFLALNPGPASSFQIWEVARATAAAPRYFTPLKHDNREFYDGGITSNNPSLQALGEMQALLPDTPINCMVSIGSGIMPPEEPAARSSDAVIRLLTTVVTETQDTERLAFATAYGRGVPYFRFNPELQRRIAIDEWIYQGSPPTIRTLNYIERVAEKFLMRDEILDNLRRCAEKLAKPTTTLAEDRVCLQDLQVTDPRMDKKRIEETKGGLLEDSYRWILENPDFQRWCNNQHSRLLWIKGDPGRGKTMLLCGIVNELEKSMAKTDLLSYFFCQAVDPRINTATAVLRGLVYLLVDQQPSLVSHIRKKYDYAGKALFEDANAWVALSEILTDILQDPSLKGAYLIVDALDECVTGLPKLLDFIVQTSCVSARAKWIVSSRNWPDIEERLEKAGQKVELSLELNAASVSTAVHFYIRYRVAQLALDKRYREKEKNAVLAHLTSNANDTFLWVALVCQHLGDIPRWRVLAKLEALPPGLDALYNQMMQHISTSDDADLCKRILALIAVIYRPITLDELTYLCEPLEDMADDLASVQQIVGLCGSFLTIRSGKVYFVHQSAKDFLYTQAISDIFPSGTKEVHHAIFLRSLQVMSKTLRRDMYSLGALGYPADQVEEPEPDPLAASRYSCIYWIDHLFDGNHDCFVRGRDPLQDQGPVDNFLTRKYLYWLEALSLCKSMSKGVISMAKLETLIKVIGTP